MSASLGEEKVMKKLNSLALCAILAPALGFASGSVIAQESRTQESRTTADREQAQGQNPNDPQSRGMSGDTTQPHRGMSGDTTQPNRDMSRDTTKSTLPGDRTQSQAATGQSMGHGTFIASKPARGFHADKLIGSDVKAQAGGEEVGTISDLIIDEDGQVVAVIVGVGGFLGMGEKDVAIGWDALQRTAKSGGDEYEYRVNATRDSLTTAPAYKK
jgi:sporulation protein YlmC with PRC-barrel domain